MEDSTKTMSDDELSRLAREEILKEAQIGSVRAEKFGPQGWMKCPIPPANKRFLTNTIIGTLRQSSRNDKERHDSRHKEDHKEKASESDYGHKEKTVSKSAHKERSTNKVDRTREATKRKSSYLRIDNDTRKRQRTDKRK